jgi:short-subunit dehydrogenase
VDLNNKRVVITGASQGIGAAMARGFAEAGSEVVVAARSKDKLDALAEEIGGHSVAVDLVDPDAVDAFVPGVEDALGPIDVLVSNAGIETIDSCAMVEVDTVRRANRLNLEAPMVLTRLVLPGMLRRGSGHLVYTSSLAGTSAYPAIGPYCGTKAGLTNYASCVRSEVEAHGVGVTIVAPGPVDTEMWDQVEQGSPSAKRVIRRLRLLQLLPSITPERLAADVVSAVAEGKRHVRHPKRLSANFWLNEAPRRIAELALAGVKYDPLEPADGTQRT